jgi:hypothetical protein
VRGAVLRLNDFGKDSKRLIEEIGCTTQGDVNLLKGLIPSPFLMEGLKAPVMFFQDRLFRIE